MLESETEMLTLSRPNLKSIFHNSLHFYSPHLQLRLKVALDTRPREAQDLRTKAIWGARVISRKPIFLHPQVTLPPPLAEPVQLHVLWGIYTFKGLFF